MADVKTLLFTNGLQFETSQHISEVQSLIKAKKSIKGNFKRLNKDSGQYDLYSCDVVIGGAPTIIDLDGGELTFNSTDDERRERERKEALNEREAGKEDVAEQMEQETIDANPAE